MVWTVGSGRLADVLLQRADPAAREALAALLAGALVAATLAAAGVFACRALDRQRLAAWDADWSETGPQWTGQR